LWVGLFLFVFCGVVGLVLLSFDDCLFDVFVFGWGVGDFLVVVFV
jgi:hypothetical protein